MMILPTRLTSRTNSFNIFHRAITVNNISNIFVQLPIMMSLGKFLEAVLSQFNSVVELNFQNKENRRDWLPLSRRGMDRFRSGNSNVSPGVSSIHTCREKHGGTTPLRHGRICISDPVGQCGHLKISAAGLYFYLTYYL